MGKPVFFSSSSSTFFHYVGENLVEMLLAFTFFDPFNLDTVLKWHLNSLVIVNTNANFISVDIYHVYRSFVRSNEPKLKRTHKPNAKLL